MPISNNSNIVTFIIERKKTRNLHSVLIIKIRVMIKSVHILYYYKSICVRMFNLSYANVYEFLFLWSLKMFERKSLVVAFGENSKTRYNQIYSTVSWQSWTLTYIILSYVYMHIYIYMYKWKSREREEKKRRHLDDLFSLEVCIEYTIDEKKKRRKKKRERERRGNFDKSLVSHTLCWQKRSPFVTINSREIVGIMAMFDLDNDLWVSEIDRWKEMFKIKRKKCNFIRPILTLKMIDRILFMIRLLSYFISKG
jgi:hypothetical protein